MVPWPRGTGGPRTQREVLENALSYIRFLQRTLSSVRGGAAPPADPADPSGGDPAVTQRLVPYEDEDPPKATNPWLGPTGPYWDELGRAGGVPVSPPPGRLGPLGLSPSLVASPPPPGPPDDVIRDLFSDIYGSLKAPAVAAPEPGGGSSGTPLGTSRGQRRGQKGRGGQGTQGTQGTRGHPPRAKKKCVNGFIMFCRINRKPYISAHPGVASTAATRELAQLWRSLRPDQRRPYCARARRFSRLHDRVLRPDSGDNDGDNDGDKDSDTDPPAPLQLLLDARGGGDAQGHPLLSPAP
ncbi:meiosis initiator protein isoform X1 [Patagioenas fasciata]|uniref:meiosis initiator protein isoform X1 n=1 Tax=Patagioenas fasciata TaxID=372321 RepID=UPI003A9911C9